MKMAYFGNSIESAELAGMEMHAVNTGIRRRRVKWGKKTGKFVGVGAGERKKCLLENKAGRLATERQQEILEGCGTRTGTSTRRLSGLLYY